MRQGQPNNNNKQRPRGRNRKGPNPLTRSYESNGPDVKIRGTAHHIAEKYLSLARDAQSSGDRVAAESYLQHAEHYFRIIAAAQAQFAQQTSQMPQQPLYSREEDDEEEGGDRPYLSGDRNGYYRELNGHQASFRPEEPQPFVNGAQSGIVTPTPAESEMPPHEGGGEPPLYSGNEQGGGYRGGRRRRVGRDRPRYSDRWSDRGGEPGGGEPGGSEGGSSEN